MYNHKKTKVSKRDINGIIPPFPSKPTPAANINHSTFEFEPGPTDALSEFDQKESESCNRVSPETKNKARIFAQLLEKVVLETKLMQGQCTFFFQLVSFLSQADNPLDEQAFKVVLTIFKLRHNVATRDIEKLIITVALHTVVKSNLHCISQKSAELLESLLVPELSSRQAIYVKLDPSMGCTPSDTSKASYVSTTLPEKTNHGATTNGIKERRNNTSSSLKSNSGITSLQDRLHKHNPRSRRRRRSLKNSLPNKRVKVSTSQSPPSAPPSAQLPTEAQPSSSDPPYLRKQLWDLIREHSEKLNSDGTASSATFAAYILSFCASCLHLTVRLRAANVAMRLLKEIASEVATLQSNVYKEVTVGVRLRIQYLIDIFERITHPSSSDSKLKHANLDFRTILSGLRTQLQVLVKMGFDSVVENAADLKQIYLNNLLTQSLKVFTNISAIDGTIFSPSSMELVLNCFHLYRSAKTDRTDDALICLSILINCYDREEGESRSDFASLQVSTGQSALSYFALLYKELLLETEVSVEEASKIDESGIVKQRELRNKRVLRVYTAMLFGMLVKDIDFARKIRRDHLEQLTCLGDTIKWWILYLKRTDSLGPSHLKNLLSIARRILEVERLIIESELAENKKEDEKLSFLTSIPQSNCDNCSSSSSSSDSDIDLYGTPPIPLPQAL